MLTDLVLALITLASAVVGTILNPKLRVKIVIIVLACGASAGTLFKSYQDHFDKEFITAALAAQLATSTPTVEFNRALDQGVERVARKHGLEGRGSITKDQGTLYFFSRSHSDIRTGAMTLSLGDRGQAFISYVAKRPLEEVVESAMFKVPDLRARDALQQVLDELAFVGWIAVDELPWVTASTTITRTTEFDSIAVLVTATERRRKVEVKLSQDFVDRMVNLPPVERDWMAYEEFRKQLEPPK